MKRICCVFNFPTHYRFLIYKKIEEEFNADFIFGDKLPFKLKRFNVSRLHNFKFYLETKFLKYIHYQKGLVGFFIKSKYEVYIISGELRNISLWICLFSSLFNKKKIVLWSHAYSGKENILTRILKKTFFKMSYHVLTYGDRAKSLMLNSGFQSEDVSVIYNSLDYYTHQKIRLGIKQSDVFAKHFNNQYPTLCFIGRLVKEKKIDMLIEAIYELHQRSYYCNLILIGEEDDEKSLYNKACKLDLLNFVWFYGASYDESTNAQLLYDSTLCISPGDIGLTAIHSLMFGTPIVTHNDFSSHGPEVEAIENENSGLFFIKDDLSDLCSKIIQGVNLFTSQREVTRKKCYKIIDSKYNPDYQISILKKIL